MASRTGFKRAIFFDSVHVIMVDYQRREAKLYENAGSGEGQVLIRDSDAADKASVTNPYELVDMAFRYAISFELLGKIVDKEVMQVFERIGVKDFLERVIAATTEEMRRDRFHGFAFKFVPAPSMNGVTSEQPVEAEVEEDEDDYGEEDEYYDDDEAYDEEDIAEEQV